MCIRDRFMTDHILPHNHGEHLNTELLIDNIAKTEDFQIVADLFKVLGDNSRVRTVSYTHLDVYKRQL